MDASGPVNGPVVSFDASPSTEAAAAKPMSMMPAIINSGASHGKAKDPAATEPAIAKASEEAPCESTYEIGLFAQ